MGFPGFDTNLMSRGTEALEKMANALVSIAQNVEVIKVMMQDDRDR